VAASHGLDVVEVEFLGGGKHRTLRIYIEKNAAGRAKLAEQAAERAKAAEEADETPGDFPSGFEDRIDQLAGVTHEDCVAFSTDFGTVLDVEDLVGGSSSYDLEVSSPGLDRKLYGPEDYQRFGGSLARLQTRQPVEGNRHWQGRIGAVEGNGFVLELAAGQAKAKGSGKKAAKAGKAAARNVRLKFNNIEKANLEPEI
jgi:ribosome maturation factor RimP